MTYTTRQNLTKIERLDGQILDWFKKSTSRMPLDSAEYWYIKDLTLKLLMQSAETKRAMEEADDDD